MRHPTLRLPAAALRVVGLLLLACSIAQGCTGPGSIRIEVESVAAPTAGRHIHTNRPRPRQLPLATEEDCFTFAIFGDRTGGKPAGLKYLRQAVLDTNLIDPDLVMTVGDLVQGYGTPEDWSDQAAEFKGIMDGLRMPWFPVAGNHDTYGPKPKNRPRLASHAERYEIAFGPLWYWFTHKDSAFLVLYSDEGDPQTGAVGFGKPELQKMSPEQLAWLRGALATNAHCRHVFVFLHHPRWRGGNYGDDWERVHAELAKPGNVAAVFAGHIHHMVYGGRRDGIEYYALAATGANISKKYPERAGYLHHFNTVTVRPEGIQVATIPVGTVLDPKDLTHAVVQDVRKLTDAPVEVVSKPLDLPATGALTEANCTVRLRNPTSRKVEFQLRLAATATDSRWRCVPDHVHVILDPGTTGHRVTVRLSHPAPRTARPAAPALTIEADYLGEGIRIAARPKRVPVPLAAASAPRIPKQGRRDIPPGPR